MDDRHLDDVYDVRGAPAMRELYDSWADGYDMELRAVGYVTPARIAEMLARFCPDRGARILDFACGTGLSGVALADLGFTNVDGCDLSAGMLEHAARTGVYQQLWESSEHPEIPHGRYAAITACGAVSRGAAEAAVLDTLTAALAPGALLVFSYNDHTLADPEYQAALDRQITDGCSVLAREDGEHLPAIGLRSTVFVLRR
ncbi:MAG: methyltransferase type 12 [Actinomycetales bacterium]|nr:MAG: methyltransferase type 12 [Actinomycetales bacterium]